MEYISWNFFSKVLSSCQKCQDEELDYFILTRIWWVFIWFLEKIQGILTEVSRHGIPICVQLKMFYNELVPSLISMLYVSSSGVFISKSYEKCYKLIEIITAKTYQWPVRRAANIVVTKKLVGVHEVTQTITLAAQVAKMHQMMKNMVTSSDTPTIKPVKVETNVNVVGCVYCRWAHLFEECLINYVSVNYMGKNKYQTPTTILTNQNGVIILISHGVTPKVN